MKLGRAAAMRSITRELFTITGVRLSPTLRLQVAVDEMTYSFADSTNRNNTIARIRELLSRFGLRRILACARILPASASVLYADGCVARRIGVDALPSRSRYP